jgi:hypothetical protein
MTAHLTPDVDDLADAADLTWLGPSDRPNLGLATTRQLLQELMVRFYPAVSPDGAIAEPYIDLDYSTVGGERGIHLEDSPHVNHAIRELDLCGQTAEDPVYVASLVRTVKEFFSYGHSGGSAETAIWQLHQLLQGHALSPLTDDPAEWVDRTEISGTPWWQNRRDTRAMSHDQGKTFWLVDNDPHPDNPQHVYALFAPGGVEAYLLEDRKWWYRSQPAGDGRNST